MTDRTNPDDLFSQLGREILQRQGSSRSIVAIDGIDAAGKTHFANSLAATFASAGHHVLRASIDDFHRSRAERHARGTGSAEGFYLDSYDYETFLRVLIDPFRANDGRGVTLGAFDHVLDAPSPATLVAAQPRTTLIVDGIFLQRPQLRGLWDYTIWLEVPRTIADARALERDGPTGVGDRYTGGQALYRAQASPRERADVVIDNGDFNSPQRLREMRL